MKIGDLADNVSVYETVLKEIDRKRNLWKSETKSIIKETLDEIKKTYPIYWQVQVLEGMTNSEGVNITFGKTPSGIYISDETRTKSYIKNGGTLVFSQAYNGDIFVLIIYPSVEELVIPIEKNSLLTKIDPTKIDSEFIIKQVDNFLKEMILWESSQSSSTPIGF